MAKIMTHAYCAQIFGMIWRIPIDVAVMTRTPMTTGVV